MERIVGLPNGGQCIELVFADDRKALPQTLQQVILTSGSLQELVIEPGVREPTQLEMSGKFGHEKGLQATRLRAFEEARSQPPQRCPSFCFRSISQSWP